MTPSRILCSDEFGGPVEPRCRICQMNATLELVDEMFDRGSTHELVVEFIAECTERAVDVTADSVRNHASRRETCDPIRHF